MGKNEQVGNVTEAVDYNQKVVDSHIDMNPPQIVEPLTGSSVLVEPKELKDNSYAVMANYLACGLDPKKCTLYFQSQIPAHARWSPHCIRWTHGPKPWRPLLQPES